MDRREKTFLRKLEGVLERRPTRIAIDAAISEAKGQLDADRQSQVGSVQVPLSECGQSLPADIKSCRVFVLRAGSEFQTERHPNSHQLVLSLEGTGKIRVFEKPTPRDVFLRSDMHGPLELRWASLSENIWHQPVSGNEDWVVLTFHTASEMELIDEYKD
jgi:hypothetical protein